jgi:hypothetical protein
MSKKGKYSHEKGINPFWQLSGDKYYHTIKVNGDHFGFYTGDGNGRTPEEAKQNAWNDLRNKGGC